MSSAQRFDRAASCAASSGMFVSRHPAHRFDERFPRPPLLGEDAPPFGGELVEPAPALVRLLHPRPLDPLPLLEILQKSYPTLRFEIFAEPACTIPIPGDLDSDDPDASKEVKGRVDIAIKAFKNNNDNIGEVVLLYEAKAPGTMQFGEWDAGFDSSIKLKSHNLRRLRC